MAKIENLRGLDEDLIGLLAAQFVDIYQDSAAPKALKLPVFPKPDSVKPDCP